MTETPDIAEVARRLSETQREWILSASSNHRGWYRVGDYCPMSTRSALLRRGIISHGCLLTPLGLAVRAHLLQEQDR